MSLSFQGRWPSDTFSCGHEAGIVVTTTKRHRPTRLLLLGIGPLVTNDPARRGSLGVIENAAVLVSGGLVERVSSESLEIPYRGWIGEGPVADCVVFEADSYLHLPYRPDSDLMGAVIKGGRVERGVL